MLKEIDPKQVKERYDELNIIDVRELEEFFGELGHIEKADCIPLSQLVNHIHRLDRNQSYLLVCRSGRRSLEAMSQMQAVGFEHLYNLKGGMLAWNQYWNKESP